jgi:Alpha/beta hydrolase domain
MTVHHSVQLAHISHCDRSSETSVKGAAFELQTADMFVEIGVGQLDQPLDLFAPTDGESGERSGCAAAVTPASPSTGRDSQCSSMRRSPSLLGSICVATIVLTGCSGSGAPSAVSETAMTTETTTEASATTEASESTEVPDLPDTTDAQQPMLAPVQLSGPVNGGAGIATAARQDLAAAGYVEEEFFFEGDATAYAADGELAQNGLWTIRPDTTAAFRSRFIVRRPVSAATFSGTVVVEWLNVSAGADGDPDWGYSHREILRAGHAWVGVSAQAVGVSGGASILDSVPAAGGLVAADPARYGTLIHPGDRFAFDIFTQAATAVVNPAGPDALGGLEPTQIIAIGESQSAFFLTSYINGVHPLVQLFDGFLVHSRANFAPSFETGEIDRSIDVAYNIRTDLDDPVLIFSTETDLTTLGYAKARQDDTNTVRSWEVAGTAAIARDERGNARGGIRTPLVDVPLAALSGDPAEGSGGGFCFLFGSTTPFDVPTIASLYATREAYAEAFASSLATAVADGFVLEADVDPMTARALNTYDSYSAAG